MNKTTYNPSAEFSETFQGHKHLMLDQCTIRYNLFTSLPWMRTKKHKQKLNGLDEAAGFDYRYGYAVSLNKKGTLTFDN